MKFLFSLFIIIFIPNSFAQQFKVTGAENAFIQNGEKLVKNDELPDTGRVSIKAEGYLFVANSSGWSFGIWKQIGSYDLDSIYLISQQGQSIRDSVKVIIDSIFPNGIKGKFNSVCTTDYYGSFQKLSYGYGNIAFLNVENKIPYDSDTLTLRWRDPKYKGGKYFLVFQNMFDEIVDYRISETSSCFIDYKYLPVDAAGLTVYSADGRASSMLMLSRTKK